MNLFDYLLLAFVGLSMVWSLWRGFVREILSLLAWIAAFLAAAHFSAPTATALKTWITPPIVADLIAFVLVFLAVMVLAALVGAGIRRLLQRAELTAFDRGLGVLFGLARGLLLVALFFLIYTSFAKPDKPWMRDSVLTKYAVEMGDLLGRAIPSGYPFSRRREAQHVRRTSFGDAPLLDRHGLETVLHRNMMR